MFMPRLIRRSFTTTTPYVPIHTPVMLNQVLSQLPAKPGGVYCDLTFGDGGYTKALLDRCDCTVVAMDQDPTTYEKAQQLAEMDSYRGRLLPLLGRFSQLDRLVQEQLKWTYPCFDGMMLDIGVSSGQLEDPSRGFSYKLDGPLDMRMFSRGRNAKVQSTSEASLLDKSISAFEIVNYFSGDELAEIIYTFGGDRASRKIAARIVEARKQGPIETTRELASIVQKASRQPRWQRGHDDVLRNSAARTFQALRIHVNDELNELKSALGSSETLLRPGGRLAVVTFHSLEDRLVKTFLQHCSGRRSLEDANVDTFKLKRNAFRENQKRYRQGVEDEEWVRQADPPTRELIQPSFDLCTKHVIRPSPEELESNPRSRSAKLRAAQRTDAPSLAPF